MMLVFVKGIIEIPEQASMIYWICFILSLLSDTKYTNAASPWTIGFLFQEKRRVVQTVQFRIVQGLGVYTDYLVIWKLDHHQ